MHPQLGIPQLYHDQLNIIGQYLWDIKNHPEWQQDVHQTIIQPHVLTLKLLKKVVVMDRTWINLQTKQNIFKIAAIKKRKRLTRRVLQLQEDWNDLLQSEF